MCLDAATLDCTISLRDIIGIDPFVLDGATTDVEQAEAAVAMGTSTDGVLGGSPSLLASLSFDNNPENADLVAAMKWDSGDFADAAAAVAAANAGTVAAAIPELACGDFSAAAKAAGVTAVPTDLGVVGTEPAACTPEPASDDVGAAAHTVDCDMLHVGAANIPLPASDDDGAAAACDMMHCDANLATNIPLPASADDTTAGVCAAACNMMHCDADLATNIPLPASAGATAADASAGHCAAALAMDGNPGRAAAPSQPAEAAAADCEPLEPLFNGTTTYTFTPRKSKFSFVLEVPYIHMPLPMTAVAQALRDWVPSYVRGAAVAPLPQASAAEYRAELACMGAAIASAQAVVEQMQKTYDESKGRNQRKDACKRGVGEAKVNLTSMRGKMTELHRAVASARC